MAWCNMQIAIYFHIYCDRIINWLLLLFENMIKYNNTMLSIFTVSLRKKYAKSRQMKKVFLFHLSVNGIEKPDKCGQKFLTFFNSVTRSTCCNVSLNIMIARQKYRMANILSSRVFSLQIWKQQKTEAFGSRSLKLHSIDRLFESKKIEKS